MQITPTPADEEVAAIAAAIQAMTTSGAAGAPLAEPSRWRWSGRWWAKPVPQRRNRPW